MASCKDCIHENLCVIKAFPDAFENTQWEKKPCDHFKPKTEWISVDERLPEELTHVIVCDEDGTVGEAFCYKEGRFEWMDSEELAFVTHWMPLPEPPKGAVS